MNGDQWLRDRQQADRDRAAALYAENRELRRQLESARRIAVTLEQDGVQIIQRIENTIAEHREICVDECRFHGTCDVLYGLNWALTAAEDDTDEDE